MSFRLSAELEALASAAALAAGYKNASAWCQRLALEALSKIGESNQDETNELSFQSASSGDLLKAVDNLRQLNLDCFKISLKNDEQYKEFLNVVIASEEEWETINQAVNDPQLETRMPADEPVTAAKTSAVSEILGKENEAFADKPIAEVNSNDYLLFAEEMKNEIAELVGGEREFSVFQNGRVIESGESAI